MPQRPVWLEASNAITSTTGRFGSCWMASTSLEGGHLFTAGPQHWMITVGELQYQAIMEKGLNRAGAYKTSGERTGRTHFGTTQVGTTNWSDADIAQYIERWNSELGGKRPFDVLCNNCQTFVTHFVHFLCDGQGTLPNQAGFSMTEDNKSWNMAASVGEVACVNAGGTKVAVSGTTVGMQHISGEGGFFQAEMFKATACADTPLGRLGVHFGPNMNTGFGVRNGNAEATVLGWGGTTGKDGVGVRTPFGGADCSVM